MDTIEGLRDAARRGRECAVIGQAVTLARWIGNGRRPVTAVRVLRKADVPAAGVALGADMPPRHRQEAALAGQPVRRRPRNLPGLDVPAVELPPGLTDADTIGVIYDETDGLNFYPEYGMLVDLFGNPGLAADRRYADVLRGYLGSETIAPLPLQRLAAAYPETVDAVFRKILRRRDFTWAEHGEALMRRRKAWYYRHEPRPGVSVIGDRLLELASGGRR